MVGHKLNALPSRLGLPEQDEQLTESSQAIEALHDRIWMVVLKVMEDAGKPVADGLGIAMRLVDMLPPCR